MAPKNATVRGDGFRVYEWPGGDTELNRKYNAVEPVNLLSVTSIKSLAGESFQLVAWKIANVVNIAMGVRKATRIGPRGGVKEVYVKDGPFPGEFVTRMVESRGVQEKLDETRQWLRASADEPRDVAAVRGTVVHKMIELGLPMSMVDEDLIRTRFENQWKEERRKVKPDVTPDDVNFVVNAMRQYWAMREAVPFVIIAQEPQVFNLCHTVGTRVLTRDLRWVNAEDLKPGNSLWAFSEGLAWRPGARYTWEPGEVTATRLSEAPVVRVTLASGKTLTVTPYHPFMAMRRAAHAPSTRTRVEWVEAQYLRVGDILPRYLDPWDEATTREAGWFAGMLDGEGWVARNRVSFAQNEGPVAERMRAFMRSVSLTWTEHRKTKNPDGCIAFTINGSLAQNASLLGRLRPTRLLAKFNPTGQQLDARQASLDTVVSVEDAGVQTVVNLTTSTKTYFADGYGSHNTVGYGGSADAIIWFLGTFDDEGNFTPIPGQDTAKWQKAADKGTLTLADVEKVGGTLAVGDWKTSKSVYTSHIVQTVAYMSGEFIAEDGLIDERLTAILRRTSLGLVIHIRPDGWGVEFFDYREDILTAFVGSAVYARFLAAYKEPTALFTKSIHGKAEGTENSEVIDDE